MTGEIPDDVIAAVKHIITWAHGHKDEVDAVLEWDAPVLEAWLIMLGVISPDGRRVACFESVITFAPGLNGARPSYGAAGRARSHPVSCARSCRSEMTVRSTLVTITVPSLLMCSS
jgi:hypothetical protein